MPKQEKPLTLRQQKFALNRAKGMRLGEAAVKAGETSKRAKRGNTGWEWEQDPRVRELILQYAREAMAEEEVDNIIAAQARGLVPTKVVEGFGGRAEYDMLGALSVQARILGKFKVEVSGPDGGPVTIAAADVSDEDLLRRIGQLKRIYEAAAKVEAEGTPEPPSE